MRVMDEEAEVTPGMRTQCHHCKGDGYILKYALVVMEGQFAGTHPRPSQCPTCKGKCWLPGFVIPV